MDFSRSVEIAAPFEEVWALVNDVPSAATCIPGIHDITMIAERAFTCVLTQKVGSVRARFALTSELVADDARRVVTAQTRGADPALGSTVDARQTFTLVPAGDQGATVADVRISGRIATFGHRVIAAKAEQVTLEAIRNVDELLAARRVSGR